MQSDTFIQSIARLTDWLTESDSSFVRLIPYQGKWLILILRNVMTMRCRRALLSPGCTKCVQQNLAKPAWYSIDFGIKLICWTRVLGDSITKNVWICISWKGCIKTSVGLVPLYNCAGRWLVNVDINNYTVIMIANSTMLKSFDTMIRVPRFEF